MRCSEPGTTRLVSQLAVATVREWRPICAFKVIVDSGVSATDLFGLLVDIYAWPTWQPFDSAELETSTLRRAEQGNVVTRGSAHVGDVWALRGHRGSTTVIEISELLPDRRLSYIGLRVVGLRDYKAAVELECLPAGRLRLTWTATFRPQLPGTGRFWEWYLDRHMNKIAHQLCSRATAKRV